MSSKPKKKQRRMSFMGGGWSILIEGIAGMGKSYFVCGVAERLRSLGKNLTAINKTHIASSRIDGHTADMWVRRYILAGTPAIDCLWVVEVGQLDIKLKAQSSKLQYVSKPIQFISR